MPNTAPLSVHPGMDHGSWMQEYFLGRPVRAGTTTFGHDQHGQAESNKMRFQNTEKPAKDKSRLKKEDEKSGKPIRYCPMVAVNPTTAWKKPATTKNRHLVQLWIKIKKTHLKQG